MCLLGEGPGKTLCVQTHDSHDSSDDYKFPVTANKILSEKTAIFYVVTISAGNWVRVRQTLR